MTGVVAALVAAAPLMATASPSLVSGSAVSGLTAQVFVTATGGTGAYSYSWEYVSGDWSLGPSDPTGAITPFSGSGVSQSMWRCLVSDGVGSAYTNTITARLV